MTAKPANPPTTPPTTAGVFTEFPPPDPAPKLTEDVGAEAVPLGPPMPPMMPPVLDAELDELEDNNCVLEAAEDEELVRDDVEVLAEEIRDDEVRLEAPDEVREVLLAKLERDLVDVTSVLFGLKLENTGGTVLGSAEVVCAPDCVNAVGKVSKCSKIHRTKTHSLWPMSNYLSRAQKQ